MNWNRFAADAKVEVDAKAEAQAIPEAETKAEALRHSGSWSLSCFVLGDVCKDVAPGPDNENQFLLPHLCFQSLSSTWIAFDSHTAQPSCNGTVGSF